METKTNLLFTILSSCQFLHSLLFFTGKFVLKKTADFYIQLILYEVHILNNSYTELIQN